MQVRPRRSTWILAALLLAQPALYAQSSFTIVSAASYQPTVAPGSLASLFGANLAAVTASATLDANGQLPTQLAGISVEVEGTAAALIYVSPLQVNFVIPDNAPSGADSVVIRSTDTGATRSGNMQVQNTAPGIFTADASGKGAGSILNAVTYAGPPFLVETSAIAGSDQRTRLSLYGTGLRYAGNPSHDPAVTNVAANIQAVGQDPSGQRQTLIVEYAGAAPGYFGLDQVNVVLPAEFDGAGAVSLVVTADTRSSNIVTFQMASLPADAIRLTGLALSTAAVTGSDAATATVSLNAPARSIGFPISLRADNPAVQIPLSLTIPAGKVSATAAITTSAVNTVLNVTVTATGNGVSKTASLEVDPSNAPALTNFLITPDSVQGGKAASGTVTLGAGAPAGGATVQLASDDSVAQPPATLSIPFGRNSATFSIPTSAVTALHSANLTATYGRGAKTVPLTVLPVIQLNLKSSVVVGGNSVNGSVTLGEPATVAGVTLNLQCDNRTIAQPPLTVAIPSGQTSVAFTVTTIPVTIARTVTITVTYSGTTQSATLTVNPPGTASLSDLTITPDHVTGGVSATGTATLGAPAPAGGASVSLTSSAPITAQVPLFVTVPQGQTRVSFSIVTSHVTTAQTVTITGSAAGVAKTATLTVQ